MSKNSTLKQGLLDARILETWATAAGPQLAKHTRAIKMKAKTLFIEVDNPTWKKELHANKKLALQRLNQKLSETLPKDAAPQDSKALPKIESEIEPKIWVEDLFLLSPNGLNPTISKPKFPKKQKTE